MNVRILGLAVAAILAGCEALPPPIPLPEQRTPLAAFRPHRVEQVADFAHGGQSRIVSGILGPVNGWSWTGQRPVVRVTRRRAGKAVFIADFTIPENTLAATGPVTIRFFVNDHELTSERYTTPGPRHIQQEIPQAWVPLGSTLIRAEIDKVWVSPGDGARLGFILSKLGIAEE